MIQKGLQPADAEDVVQTVLVSVSKAVENWKPDPQKARFRTWLNRIAHNAAINAITRRKPDRGAGGTKGAILMSDQSDQNADSKLILLEQRHLKVVGIVRAGMQIASGLAAAHA